jgi:hypothetical protein
MTPTPLLEAIDTLAGLLPCIDHSLAALATITGIPSDLTPVRRDVHTLSLSLRRAITDLETQALR